MALIVTAHPDPILSLVRAARAPIVGLLWTEPQLEF
jgi:hypothetical protein